MFAITSVDCTWCNSVAQAYSGVLGGDVLEIDGDDVRFPLDLLQDCICVGQTGFVSHDDRTEWTDDRVQLLLDTSLHFWMMQHQQKRPSQGCHRRLNTGNPQIPNGHAQLDFTKT